MQLLDVRGSVRFQGLNHVPAAQQPAWDYHTELGPVRAELAEVPALVDEQEIWTLRQLLAEVESGNAHVLHVGECAELFTMANPQQVERRVALYVELADHLASRTGRNVVLVARMAGQHAKPRSQSVERLIDGTVLPAYRGDAVNSLDVSAAGRHANPRRLLTSYQRSYDTLRCLQDRRHQSHPVFVSHEALLRDYEEPLTRGGHLAYAGSAHLVWIGDRTRRLWNWHVQWARLVSNPVGVKIGPTTSPSDLTDLIHALNPRREPGRLSLITRMGATAAGERVRELIRAAASCRSPIVWQCDPMHGNTHKLGNAKLRLLPDLRAEVTAFVGAMRAARSHPAGLHLEVTPEAVNECREDLPADGKHHESPPCDPRLNPQQALEIVDHFANELG
ncbi:3-deoxy-7-phosphoheptulonate synthase class II [Flindersiella endophytica]